MFESENVFTVTEVNRHLKNVIESNIPNILVGGEIANLTIHSSGHYYLTLKDELSSLKCVFFKTYNSYLDFPMENGNKIIALGKLTVFEKAGNYQLNIFKAYAAGLGELQLQFERLKKKLAAEGLFDDDHKISIPAYPETIGVITSATGAAIEDIRNVISRRYPCRILLYAATVQGERAPDELIAGLTYFNRNQPVDLIIIGRGGGSQEDLFCFNNERLARAIYDSAIPVISAVGHEIDFTIADFVADLRAPTPSAAAELAVPSASALKQRIADITANIRYSLTNYLYSRKLELGDLEQALRNYQPDLLVMKKRRLLDETTLNLKHSVEKYLTRARHEVTLLDSALKELSPFNALQRGYSLVRKERRIIKSVRQIDPGEKLEIIMSDGNVNCLVESIREEEID
ncbi:MAG: exodeoxyribonuclease VII large subunit [Candidatus Cloacimonetes bacterium]|nr:exodeoxyribonuclease VII large subunit [Candidatus Cloacimonadota bacterium]